MREFTVRGRRYRLRSKGMLLMGSLLLVTAVVCLCFLVAGLCMRMRADRAAAAGQQVTAEGDDGRTAPVCASATSESGGMAGPSAEGTSSPARDNSGPESGDWRLQLVNAKHPLATGFAVETAELPNGLLIDRRVREELLAMINAGEAQGLDFVICSAYRSVEKQRELYDDKVARLRNEGMDEAQALEAAVSVVALPGTSEHHTGLAVDIVAYGYQQLDNGILNTPEYKWLKDNCHRFGFILRYPEGKSSLTGVIFEPWHYRYVGKDAAAEIMGQGLCLEEYVGMTD